MLGVRIAVMVRFQTKRDRTVRQHRYRHGKAANSFAGRHVVEQLAVKIRMHAFRIVGNVQDYLRSSQYMSYVVYKRRNGGLRGQQG